MKRWRTDEGEELMLPPWSFFHPGCSRSELPFPDLREKTGDESETRCLRTNWESERKEKEKLVRFVSDAHRKFPLSSDGVNSVLHERRLFSKEDHQLFTSEQLWIQVISLLGKEHLVRTLQTSILHSKQSFVSVKVLFLSHCNSAVSSRCHEKLLEVSLKTAKFEFPRWKN